MKTGSGSVTVMTVTLTSKAFAKPIPCLTPFLATSDPSVLKRILAYIRGLPCSSNIFPKNDPYLYGSDRRRPSTGQARSSSGRIELRLRADTRPPGLTITTVAVPGGFLLRHAAEEITVLTRPKWLVCPGCSGQCRYLLFYQRWCCRRCSGCQPRSGTNFAGCRSWDGK